MAGPFQHGDLHAGQTVLIHGAAGGVGSMATQLAREAGAYVVGTGRAADRETALGIGVHEFLDLAADNLEGIGQVDLVLDVIGRAIGERSIAVVRAGGTLVTIAGPPSSQPKDGRAVFFVVEPDRAQLVDIAQRVRDGRPHTTIGQVAPFDGDISSGRRWGRWAHPARSVGEASLSRARSALLGEALGHGWGLALYAGTAGPVRWQRESRLQSGVTCLPGG